MKIKLYNNYDSQLLREWKSLWNSLPYATISNSPEWFVSAKEAFHPNEVRIIALYSEMNILLGIGGFFRKTICTIPFWSIAGDEFSDKESILIDYSNREAVALFLSAIEGSIPLILTNYTDKTLQNIKRIKHTNIMKADENLYVDFHEGPYGNMKQRKITLTNNRIKNNTHDFSCDMKTQCDIAEKKLANLQVAFEIEKNSSKSKKGRMIFHKESSRNFYTNLILALQNNSIVTIIYIDSLPIAYSIAFTNRGVIQTSQKAHLSSHNYFNPGRILVMKLCDYARSQNNSTLDLGRGSDRFKSSIATRREDLYTIIVSKNIFIRVPLLLILKLRSWLYTMLVKYDFFYLFYKKLVNSTHYD